MKIPCTAVVSCGKFEPVSGRQPDCVLAMIAFLAEDNLGQSLDTSMGQSGAYPRARSPDCPAPCLAASVSYLQ